MTDSVLLREKIKKSGYKMSHIADCSGLTYQGLLNKINNRNEFKADEMQALRELLNLSNEEVLAVFFAQDVDKMSTKGGEPHDQ